MYHWNAMPGGGAVEGRDGFHQIGHLIALGGLTLPNIEVYEQLYPVHFKRQELRPDGAGAGEYRGGCGIEYEAEVERSAEYSFRGEGIGVVSGFGINGGLDGAVGDMQICEQGGVPFEAPPYGRKEFGPATVTARSPGGGGWGDPKRRQIDSVVRDVKDGIVSEAEACSVYGVALRREDDQLLLDEAATRALRES
jgi:N-methylhydantoinase B